MIDVCLLGTGGMMPLPGRWLSSALLRTAGHSVLLDCGEGTQISQKQVGWSFKSIGTICLSHFHADHCSGLVGMLFMLAHSDRTEEVTIVGPPGLADVVEGQRRIAPHLPYPIRCLELRGGETFQAGPLLGRALAADHHVPCLAYRFDLPRARRFEPERAEALGIPVERWKDVQRGATLEIDGRTITPDDVLGPPRPGLSVGYVTDTRPTAEMPAFFRGVELLLCEGTFPTDEQLERAAERKHMTFSEAARLAREAAVKTLWITHFSPSVERPQDHAEVARRVFPDSVVGRDHLQTTLRFDDAIPDGAPA